MPRKQSKIEIRCDEETRTKFKQVGISIDENADYEEILLTLLDTYRENPDLVERVHEYGTTFDGI